MDRSRAVGNWRARGDSSTVAPMVDGSSFPARPPRWRAFLALAYGYISYASFGLVLLAAVLFFTGLFPWRSLDEPARSSASSSLLVNVSLLLGFGVTHSTMARDGFKRVWTHVVPAPVERSTYVLVACAVLGGLIWHFEPMPTVVWHVSGPLQWLVWALFGAAAVATVATTFAVNHFEYLGLDQVRSYARGERFEPPPLAVGGLHAYVRHPMVAAVLAFLWITPHMTLGHLVLSLGFTVYALLGIRFEERTLLRVYGESYARYRRQVPMLVPRLWPTPARNPSSGNTSATP
jgi:protein-S-isoprenylcysteine O-methyltransferase Ste14